MSLRWKLVIFCLVSMAVVEGAKLIYSKIPVDEHWPKDPAFSDPTAQSLVLFAPKSSVQNFVNVGLSDSLSYRLALEAQKGDYYSIARLDGNGTLLGVNAVSGMPKGPYPLIKMYKKAPCPPKPLF